MVKVAMEYVAGLVNDEDATVSKAAQNIIKNVDKADKKKQYAAKRKQMQSLDRKLAKGEVSDEEYLQTAQGIPPLGRRSRHGRRTRMNITAHGAYAFAIYFAFYTIFWHTCASGILCFFIIAAGMVPDFDSVYYIIAKKQSINDPLSQHHLYSWTHWPSSYSPFIIFFALSLMFNAYPEYFLITIVGPYAHCLFDSVSCGDGMMWGMSFLRKRRGEYARFVNLDARATDGYHGNYYFARYRRTKYFIIENVTAVGVISFVCWRILLTGFDIWYGGTLAVMIGTIFMGLRRVDPKYFAEPPQGRYADYHADPAYVTWFQKRNGYSPPRKYETTRTN